MASLRSVRKRIGAVRNTAQITKAMKMVAAAKFRKAQEAVLAARPFSRELVATLRRLAYRKDVSDHALFARREPVKNEDIFVLTSDRGLCGAFNANVLRKVEHHLLDNHERRDQIHLSTIGRKGYSYFSKHHATIRENITDLLARPTYRQAVQIAESLSQRFQAGEVDKVTLVYNEFHSAVQQQVVFHTLLPLEPPEGLDDKREALDYIYEPGQETVLDRIIHRYLANQLYMVAVESVASEHGARMSAMENATENANDMIGRLTMVYNKARQSSITKELMEIVGGAEALKGSAA
jgi:F-type H+-transporting ATPase subunit gamma